MLLNVKIFMGGVWILVPKFKYVNSEVCSFYIEAEDLAIADITYMVLRNGYWNALHYECKYPWGEMETGLRPLRNDNYIRAVVNEMLLCDEDTLEVYVELGINTPILEVMLDSSEDEVAGPSKGSATGVYDDGDKMVRLLLKYGEVDAGNVINLDVSHFRE